MPLLDHFHPPLSRRYPARSFCGMWAVAIARLLNASILPASYRALPFVVREEEEDSDDLYVEVVTGEDKPRLAAAIELVSPRNKDRAKSREVFAAKCAEHLRRGCGVVVVDVVTTRHADMHAEVLAMLEAGAPAASPGGLAAVSYRSFGREADGQLQVWPFALEVGAALPTVPLWLGGETAVPLDLEASHTAACVDLRIRQAG
jgi:hypothetical protein